MRSGRDIKRRKSASRFTVETLEDRIELSVGFDGAAHFVPMAASGGSASAASYQAAVTHLDNVIQLRAEQLTTLIANRTAQLDGAYQDQLTKTADATTAGGSAAGGSGMTIAQLNQIEDRFASNIARRVNVFTRNFDSNLAQVTAQYGRNNPAIKAENAAVKATLRARSPRSATPSRPRRRLRASPPSRSRVRPAPPSRPRA